MFINNSTNFLKFKLIPHVNNNFKNFNINNKFNTKSFLKFSFSSIFITYYLGHNKKVCLILLICLFVEILQLWNNSLLRKAT